MGEEYYYTMGQAVQALYDTFGDFDLEELFSHVYNQEPSNKAQVLGKWIMKTRDKNYGLTFYTVGEFLDYVTELLDDAEDLEAINEKLDKAGVYTFDEAMKLLDLDERVNSPTHYMNNGLETIDIIESVLSEAGVEGYYVGNILKYMCRYRHKNGLEDLMKARWYLDRLIGFLDD